MPALVYAVYMAVKSSLLLRFHFKNLLTGKYSISASHPKWDVAKVHICVCIDKDEVPLFECLSALL